MKEVNFSVIIAGRDGSFFWSTNEASEIKKIRKLETAVTGGVKVMTEDRLLQKLKRHKGKIFRERNSPELTKEFSRRLVACLNEKENELEKERRQDRPQEEGDLIDRRIKEKERLKREKDAAESSGSRSDRSDKHDKSEAERRAKKRKDGGDPI